jgi:predicted nucleotidyltransferase
MNTTIKNKLPQIIAVFKKYGVKEAYLFGSATNDTFNKKSDVDFLYTFDENLDYETYANNYFILVNELETILKRQVDLVAKKTLKNPYLIKSIDHSKIRLL